LREQPNILLIVIDALRARNLGCYGYSKPTSPNIDALAKEGVLFEKAYSCATTTYPSLTTIFSGKQPLSHGIMRMEVKSQLLHRNLQRIDERGTVFLPEILKSQGYTTLAVDWLGMWLKRGYDYYDSPWARKSLKRHRWIINLIKWVTSFAHIGTLQNFRNLLGLHKIHPQAVTNEVIHILRRDRNKRFFLFVHYWDTHVPYDPPREFLEKFIEYDYGNNKSIKELLSQFERKRAWHIRKRILPGVSYVNEVLARYDAGIAFVDSELGRLMEALETYGLSEETLIILTSDHGESLTEHGIHFCHHGLYDVTIHVPLIFRYPRFPKNRRIARYVQHTDIVPTIMDVLGLKNGSFDFDGESLVPLLLNEKDELRKDIYIEEADTQRKMAIRTDRFKYICALSKKDAFCRECGQIHGGIEELYDLAVDPEEINNVIKKHPHEANTLKKRLFERRKLIESKRDKRLTKKRGKPSLEHSPEEEKMIRDRLKDLGYF
jgi:arylsulfatase A-like enzyme